MESHLMIYTAWGSDEEGCYSFGPGEHPPRYDNGTLMFPDAELMTTIEAGSWEEACIKYHEFMGWEPYVPMEGPAILPEGPGRSDRGRG